MFYFTKTPGWLKKLYPSCIWSIPTNRKVLYLSFDDGPHAAATPFVLDQLRLFNARATFFCIGKNVMEEQDVYKRILNEGHRVGNHTQQHLNGWKTPDKLYLADVEKARTVIDSDLFRPPYGRISAFQIRNLTRSLKYKLIMWDVLSGDFDPSINGRKAAKRVIKQAGPGSIVVFHDSARCFKVIQEALPEVLAYFTGKGYFFEAIS
ncbi:MAG: polysaccharide deacetylase family protein [Bacteroidota bacterium]|nr:polysaccharide deacetylase family protein [Bacteroidota bacterium]MDP4250051.1 polysaccharide deacetylase family protein [Bacteroidota bacterium]